MTDAFEVWPNGASPYADLLNRFEYEAPPGETEDTWSSLGEPRYLGPRGICPAGAALEKRIRLVRGVQGAQSGRATTKYEFVYPSAFVTLINLRVHAVGHVRIKNNHETTIQLPAEDNTAYVWTKTSFAPPPPDPPEEPDPPAVLDEMDAVWNGGDPGSSAAEDWTEVASEVRGNYVNFHRELRPIRAGAKTYTYNETSARIGLHGLEWLGLSEHQDGVEGVNDGGCGPALDPEHEDLLFARLERTMHPISSLRLDATDDTKVVADDFAKIRLMPMTAGYLRQSQNVSDPPETPCSPLLTANDPGSGIVDLSISTGACLPTGLRLYRARGSGSYELLVDLRTATTHRDTRVSVGVTYKYKATSYTALNDESAYSAEQTVTVTDTTPPSVPVNIVGVGGDQIATITWDQVYEWIDGYNLYMSTSSGGPYSKKNGSPISISADQIWVQGGLDNGAAYYFVATSVDASGNESAYSAEVTVVPSP